MSGIEEARKHLAEIPNLQISEGAPLARYTRFAIGGPADIYAETKNAAAFVSALKIARASGVPYVTIGSGTNLVASDEGFRGIVLRYTADSVTAAGDTVSAESGAELQAVIDFAIARGLKGIETMAGIPGSLGAAVYGNAGAYGHSISEFVRIVNFFDGECVRVLDNAGCEFRYRESVFKRHREWVVFSAELQLAPADAAELRKTADDIMAVRNQKFPPTMKCAGSIFKNLLASELPAALLQTIPERAIREGKIPAAYFLEQAGAKGIQRGGIHVADYHANLIYNAGGGTASDLRTLIAEVKALVRTRFGIELEEEVQYVGF